MFLKYSWIFISKIAGHPDNRELDRIFANEQGVVKLTTYYENHPNVEKWVQRFVYIWNICFRREGTFKFLSKQDMEFIAGYSRPFT